MPPDVNSILRDVIKREGGDKYTNIPGDRGGPTKYGITQATLENWRKAKLTEADVQALTEAEALDIYREIYVRRPGFLALPDELVPVLTDMAVNHGPRNAIKMLQRALGVADDGVFGNVTKEAVQRLSSARLRAGMCAERQILYAKIVVGDPTQLQFLLGWTNRNAQFIRELVE
jgi:lysozyme family protein